MRKSETIVTLTCDRCKRVVDDLNMLCGYKPTFREGGRDHLRLTDLCDGCWSLLMDFLKREEPV